MGAWRRMMRGRYGCSAACGAGLPVLETVARLVASGDEVREVRGMVSGTLGFLFSACDAGVPFASAVEDARRRGYTEPDPRDDLSGTDCARKALIIARLIGRRIDLPDVGTENLVPGSLRRGAASSFLRALSPPAFADLDARIAAEKKEGRTLRYLITVTPDRATARTEPVDLASPFGRLAGPENMFVIRSARYDDVPLLISGPGAGGDVTAGAVLADLLRLAEPLTIHHSSRNAYAKT